MKKIICIVFAIVLLYCIMQLAIPNYSLDISQKDVKSISLYYTNPGTKKEVTTSEDIQLLMAEINSQNDFGNYKDRYIDGEQGFIMVFHMFSGRDFVCTYVEHSGGSGVFSDGTSNRRVSGLNMITLWNELDCEAQKEVYVE